VKTGGDHVVTGLLHRGPVRAWPWVKEADHRALWATAADDLLHALLAAIVERGVGDVGGAPATEPFTTLNEGPGTPGAMIAEAICSWAGMAGVGDLEHDETGRR